ncbi:hypothetical protein SADUNF_Sadunf14G0040100 [Salix dunnii]|uniref:Cytochrome P450 family protein n=1 Tax=Salix dunnii TaxID=1413687 RepID=A0A835JG93_9ROSI|nr:hypothetical protein SADUNF_Sadunf14G0040100 [Salix dunnii]
MEAEIETVSFICKLGKASIADQAMASLVKAPPTMSTINVHQVHLRKLKLLSNLNIHHGLRFPKIHVKHTTVRCTKLTPWEPPPATYAPTIDAGGNVLKKTSNIFETLKSEDTDEATATNSEELSDTKNRPLMQFQFLKWPMWLLGPSLLLTTGMVPTLWLPLSSVFLGPNIASLLSLIGLDCIFNLGATLFLLMADSCSRPRNQAQTCNSKPPLSYKFWNMVATISGFVIPLIMLLGSQKGILQPQLPFIPFAVLLGPYMLLLSVQFLTELLTWHWQSPVWLVTPVVYESYRLLQLMRGLKLGAELSAPTWMLHMIRGLVSWWILILGVQLMSVAWFAGFTARSRQQQSSAASGG